MSRVFNYRILDKRDAPRKRTSKAKHIRRKHPLDNVYSKHFRKLMRDFGIGG